MNEVLERIKSIVGVKPKSTAIRFTEVDGQLRFLTTFSNCFKDAHSEIISAAAHQEYVEWVNKTKQYPQLWLWHSGPQSKWGQVDFVDYVDGFVVASGLIDAGKEYIAKALEREEVKVSHGFYGLMTKDNTFAKYRTFEISPLPANRAANNWTDFNIQGQGGKEMPFSEERRKWLKDVAKYSDEKLNEMEASLSKLGENLKAAGLEWKGDDSDELVGVTKGLTDVLTQLVEYKTKQDTILAEIEGFKAKLAEFDTKVTDATKSLEDKVAEAFRPTNSPTDAGYKASESKTNIVEGEKQKEDLKWFEEIVSSVMR